MTAAGASPREEAGQLLLPPTPPRDIPPQPAGCREMALSGETMGTGWRLTAIVPPDIGDDAVQAALEQVFARIIMQMSQWEPSSALSRYNQAASGSWHRLDTDFARVLDCALNVARASNGAFDPTIGMSSELWGFGASPAPDLLPTTHSAANARRFSWKDVRVEDGGRAVFQPGGLKLDFSGIAKGHAVDAGIAVLEGLGIRHALLEIGGELRAAGLRPDFLPWWIDLEVPPHSSAPIARIGLSGWSVATSGSYLRRRSVAGESWSHTIDAASGMPIDDEILSVTVLHPGCMQADALATAITAMGADKGIAFADLHAIPARVVARSNTICSVAWSRWLD